MSEATAIAGIDMGGTRIKAILRNAETGEEIDRKIIPTNDTGNADSPAWADGILQLIHEWESEHKTPIESVGIACPGLAHRDGTHIVHMPGRLHGLVDFDFNSFLSRETFVINDAQAALIGEVLEGAAQGYSDLVMLTLGTGVGGAILANGQLLRGHLGRAGHCGHMCMDPNGDPGITGLPGTLEDAIGNHNISKRSNGKFNSTKDLTDAVKAGDAEAKVIWDKSVDSLGCGIASIVNIVDPEAILIGGGIAQVGDLLFEPLQKKLDEVEWRPSSDGVKILKASLGEWAGAIGALPMEP